MRADMTRRKPSLFFSALAALALLLTLTGCGAANGAQLKAGQKLMKAYLSDRGSGAALQNCHVDVLRPEADKLVASDFVEGTFRAGGETFEFAVNTVTGEIYTSERLPELTEKLTARLTARLGLPSDACVADCLMELSRPAWQEESTEWPWLRAHLGHVLPVRAGDLDAYAAQILADEDVRILLYLACPADELRDGRWSTGDLAGWENVEIQLFGFAADEALPTLETFPVDYLYCSDHPRVTLTPETVQFRSGEA